MTERVLATDAALELIEFLKKKTRSTHVSPVGRLL